MLKKPTIKQKNLKRTKTNKKPNKQRSKIQKNQPNTTNTTKTKATDNFEDENTFSYIQTWLKVSLMGSRAVSLDVLLDDF